MNEETWWRLTIFVQVCMGKFIVVPTWYRQNRNSARVVCLCDIVGARMVLVHNRFYKCTLKIQNIILSQQHSPRLRPQHDAIWYSKIELITDTICRYRSIVRFFVNLMSKTSSKTKTNYQLSRGVEWAKQVLQISIFAASRDWTLKCRNWLEICLKMWYCANNYVVLMKT